MIFLSFTISGSEGRKIDLSRLKITLKSDLCSASGDGFSSLIDTDVSYDDLGFPYIGGRRLKGCLRDAAVMIGSPYIKEIFGVSGQAKSGALAVSDAKIEDYEELSSEAAAAKDLSADEILSLFTYTRASTAIENDTAKDNSLRFMRVVSHYSPFTHKELVFFADVNIAPHLEDEFSDICRALRNIGYKRSRGFGAVKCEFIRENTKPVVPAGNADGEELQIDYTIKLCSNLMISGKNSDNTADHIPGTSVLGLLAWEYLKTAEADSRFEDIFLSGSVRFSNAYISDAQGKDYFPAPMIVGKIKGERSYYNILEHDPSKDNRIIKPLKNGYCDLDLNVVSPITETIYHHKHTNDPTLYTQTSLCPGQFFKGSISGKADYIRELYGLLCRCDIRFGKSRSAQYSKCSLVNIGIRPVRNKTFTVAPGEMFIALACSDILLPDLRGGYSILMDDLKKAIGFAGLEPEKGRKRKCSALKYKNITGYNTKWNLQKPSVRAIASGSTLVFIAEKEETLPEFRYIGAKQNEGCGKIMFIPANRISSVSCPSSAETMASEKVKGKLSDYITSHRSIEQMRNNAISFVEENEELYKSDIISKSQIGRFMLFVKQSGSFDELEELLRSNTISEDNKKRSQAVDGFDKIVKKSGAEKYREDHWAEYLLLILRLIKYYKRRGE